MAVKDQYLADLSYKDIVKQDAKRMNNGHMSIRDQQISNQEKTESITKENECEIRQPSFVYSTNINDKYAKIIQNEKLQKILTDKRFQKTIKRFSIIEDDTLKKQSEHYNQQTSSRNSNTLLQPIRITVSNARAASMRNDINILKPKVINPPFEEHQFDHHINLMNAKVSFTKLETSYNFYRQQQQQSRQTANRTQTSHYDNQVHIKNISFPISQGHANNSDSELENPQYFKGSRNNTSSILYRRKVRQNKTNDSPRTGQSSHNSSLMMVSNYPTRPLMNGSQNAQRPTTQYNAGNRQLRNSVEYPNRQFNQSYLSSFPRYDNKDISQTQMSFMEQKRPFNFSIFELKSFDEYGVDYDKSAYSSMRGGSVLLNYNRNDLLRQNNASTQVSKQNITVQDQNMNAYETNELPSTDGNQSVKFPISTSKELKTTSSQNQDDFVVQNSIFNSRINEPPNIQTKI